MKFFYILAILSLMSLIPIMGAEAATNPNLFVSAENSQFANHFSGSMVIEVVVNDPNLHDTDQGKGEPDVTINGKILRMVQATDGNWYAYFANVEKAKAADSTVGSDGKGLDFGVFCSRNTSTSVFGISLSETDGFAVPRIGSLVGSTNGDSSFNACTGTPGSTTNLNNVVKKAKSINTNSNIPVGQIGLNSNAWPLVQLYSFDDVIIQYNPGGPAQKVSLEYDEMQNISLNIDRDLYPNNAEVFLTVNDFQLNQDPTDEDSWTFDVGSSASTFYQAFDNSGSSSANEGPGLVDLVPSLSTLGFKNNGKLSLVLGNVLKLKTNDDQPTSSVNNGGANTFSEIVTLVEQQPNSGIFESFDSNDQSVIGILTNAPRGQAGQISYNRESVSVLTGSSTASVSLDDDGPSLTIGNGNNLRPGTEYPVILIDPDQNLNTGANDDLDVFRETAIIPTITIGNPITLEKANTAKFHSSSSTFPAGFDANSSVPDSNSDRLHIDTVTVGNASYEVFSVNLGIAASSFASILLDDSESNTSGTNWINYDLRSFEKDLGVSDFSDTSFNMTFGALGSSPITIVDAGDISSAQGFIQIDNSDVNAILAESGNVFLVIDFDSSNNDSGLIDISSETKKQPIIFDLFSFGLKNGQSITNSIYRFELEETSDNSSTFEGTLEYAVTNQLNILDPNFIQTIQTIDDEIKIIVTNRFIDESGITISYSDLDVTGVATTTSVQSDFKTHSGDVATSSQTFRFGQPVTITLKDPDLNLKKDLVDIYFVINDPNSDNVDTVGKDGVILLEVLIKDIRYKRCTVDGVEYGGLGSTGFTLVETGPSTGIFEGVFKMPSKICNKSGTALISSAGGSLDAKYYDSRDSFGNANTFSLLRSESYASFSSSPQLSSYEIIKPLSGKTEEIVLSGSVNNHRRGIPLDVTIISPDGKSQNFGATLSSSGGYRSIISINANSLSGLYEIQLSHNNFDLGSISFEVISPQIPNWIKNNAKSWASTSISNSEFIDGIEYLIEEGIIVIPSIESASTFKQTIPDWIKNNALWWADGKISDEEFVKSLQFLIKKGIIRV
ncbi:peptidase [Nitrosopumilus ureiphilus]|uniref:Peptidase n=1 Tax=Nitrosopumilus ureiphilus TaxID=1470067 RepID=A0A7D5M5S2_9ARCH|nr:peptidase [Nitrosopumilus ureiphilus]QLH07866.1 peptidase [Nitrosopumilus ureiphilus]